MFQVEKPEMVNKTFRMDKRLLDELQEVAQEEGISVNALVTQCCRYALENREVPKAKKK